MSPELELRLHRFLAGLWAKLKHSRDPEQVVRSALREAQVFLEARAACLAHVPPDEDRARVSFGVPGEHSWDLDLLTAFFRNERPKIPAQLQLAPIRRRGRLWRILALERSTDCSTREQRQVLNQVAGTISDLVQQIDHERLREIRSRIERKVMEELRPKDLFYQILHGLRTLTGYDHSSALLVHTDSGNTVELVAEQIAWRKSKSRRIGQALPIPPELQQHMRSGAVFGFERRPDGWVGWKSGDPVALAELLDSGVATEPSRRPRESSMLCAPIHSRDGIIGILKVASTHTGRLGRYEADLVRRFIPQVAVAIRNSRHTETLERRMLEAEKKNAMADLARSVAHDVNNALGSIQPLVQQLHEDSLAGCLKPEVLQADLKQIEASLQVCMRIFGGMLDFARASDRGAGHGSVLRAAQGALTILEKDIRRGKIRCEIDIPDDLPPILGSQSSLEQVLFNLLANARDAMPQGGTLGVSARMQGKQIEIVIRDTGHGISEEDLSRVLEPFYSTKKKGNGLGLAICRSIIWGMQGKFEIDSRAGEYTRVTILLPAGPAPEEAKP